MGGFSRTATLKSYDIIKASFLQKCHGDTDMWQMPVWLRFSGSSVILSDRKFPKNSQHHSPINHRPAIFYLCFAEWRGHIVSFSEPQQLMHRSIILFGDGISLTFFFKQTLRQCAMMDYLLASCRSAHLCQHNKQFQPHVTCAIACTKGSGDCLTNIQDSSR